MESMRPDCLRNVVIVNVRILNALMEGTLPGIQWLDQETDRAEKQGRGPHECAPV